MCSAQAQVRGGGEEAKELNGGLKKDGLLLTSHGEARSRNDLREVPQLLRQIVERTKDLTGKTEEDPVADKR